MQTSWTNQGSSFLQSAERKQLSVFNFINKEINVILQVDFFWLNSHNSWSFILQRLISSIASFLTIYRISRFLIFFVTRTPLINSAFYEEEDTCWWSMKRDIFHQQWPPRELMTFIERTVPLPANFIEEYMKI